MNSQYSSVYRLGRSEEKDSINRKPESVPRLTLVLPSLVESFKHTTAVQVVTFFGAFAKLRKGNN